MDTRRANHSYADGQGQTPGNTTGRNELGEQIALQRETHKTMPSISSTATPYPTSFQASQHQLELGYSQVFGAAVLPTPSSIAENSPMANPIVGENDEIHAAYIYYMADRRDKNLTAQCVHCGQRKVKNVTRQRKHVLHECPVLHAAQDDASSAEQVGQQQSPPAVPPDEVVDNLNLKVIEHTQVPASSRVAGLPQSTSMNDSSLPNTSINTNSYRSPQDQVGAANGHGVSVQFRRPEIPSSANHPLSTYHRPPVSREDSRTLEQPEPPAQHQSISAVGSRARPWMLHHEARAADAFPKPSIGVSVIKIESESYNDSHLAAFEPARILQSSRTATPLTSIEVEYDDEDSDEGQSSGESESGSDESSNEGFENDSGSQPDDDEENEETFPFDDDDDGDGDDDDRGGCDTDVDTNGETLGNTRIRATERHFGPGAIHKRRRVYKRGRRGPTKHEEPSPEFTALQTEAMRVFIDEQDNAKAMRLAQQAIGVNPEFYSAHALLSEIYFAQGEDQKAVNALYFGAHAAPRDAEIWQGVADACLRLKTIDRETALRQALNCFRRILDIDEHHHDALFQRAAIYHEMGNHGRALREYDSLLKVMPNNTSIIRQKAPLLQQLGRVDEAIKLCEVSIAHGKGTGDGAEDEFSWPDILVYTDILARCGQIDEAIVRLKRLSRWLVDREMEEFWDEVVDDDREWDSEHEPRRIEVEAFHPNLFPEELYGQALPFEVRVKLGLYRLTQGLDSRFEAFGHFEWLTPDNLDQGAPVYTHPELFLDVAKALKDVKEHEEALRYYEALLAVEAYSDTSFWLQVAATSFTCEKTEQARACYEAAKAADKNCVEARTQLGMLYAGLGNKTKALQNAEEAVEMATRGIKKSDRRRYEKKDQKAARKAAERVLKIARRLGRPRKQRTRPLGPAQLKRKQNATDRKAQKLATKIEKQTKIYERKGGSKKAAEQSDEIRTSNMKQLYSQLNEKTSAMRSGDPVARAAWLYLAQQMIEDFCSTDALFPSERHLKFENYHTEANKKSHNGLHQNQQSVSTADGKEDVQGNCITNTQLGSHDDSNYPAEYRTIPFSSWLDIFLETSLLHAKSGAQWKDACYALLRSAHNCTIWHHDSGAMLQIYTCYFACALELHDEHTLLFTVGRWFVKEYRFCTDTYRLFAALNLFYTDANGGKPSANQSEFRNPTTQKFMLRQMSALDARLPDDYNEHGEEGMVPGFMRTISAHGLNNTQEDEEMDEFTEEFKPKEMDVVLLCLYGHIIYAGDTFVSALNYFYRALTLDEKNPMVLLSIALCYAHELAKRGTEDRHMHVLNAMAVFDGYAEARLDQASVRGGKVVAVTKREVDFNRARLWQMLGLSDLALREYARVLDPAQSNNPSEPGQEWSMEAAFAASNIYAANGDPAMAKYVTERWLVVE